MRLLTPHDQKNLEEYLAPHKAECMFICNNLNIGGIEFKAQDYQGEYFGAFDEAGHLLGVIVHYWNGNVMMHARDHYVLENLISHLKKNMSRPVAGILGPGDQAPLVIKKLGLSDARFNLNGIEGLYEINLDNFNESGLPDSFKVVSAHDVTEETLIGWMRGYEKEALGSPDDSDLDSRAKAKAKRLKEADSWVLTDNGIPVSIASFNSRIDGMVQVGPVWTPPEHRNKGYARLLLAYTLFQEKLNGIKKAILFTDNPAAIKVYTAIGFKKIGEYCLAILERAVNCKT